MGDPEGRVDPANSKRAYDEARSRYIELPGSSTVTLRATARLVQNALLEGRIGRYHFTCDEPPVRGGEDKAASPLEYFLIGAAF